MAKKWVVSAKKADFNAIGQKYNISPYLARIIRNRDIISDEEIDLYLNGTRQAMHDASLLKDIDVATEIINDAIDAGAKIRIVGDYDIDGVMASYILKTGLEYMGADTDIRLPDRIKDGYGINETIIRQAANDGVELIITCDNGIAAAKEIKLAYELGMTVIVTDHHEVPYNNENGEKEYILPQADAVVNPKRPDCNYPFEGICGAMVAYKLIEYALSETSQMDTKELLDELFSFAAFATVGDVMELRDENRIAVKYGLEILKNTTNIGMKALIDVTKLGGIDLTPFHVGFVLGPCINATGRLDSAMKALELLCCVNREEAVLIAEELCELNESRKAMTLSYVKQANAIVEKEYNDDSVIVVYLPDCHESIAGIVAGRIREKYYKPSIVITKDNEGGAKGSGRSIDNYNMYEELTKVNNLFTKYGGHKMAAGLSLDTANIDELRRLLNENSLLTQEDLVEKLVIDIPLPIGYVTRSLATEIDRLAPFGVGNAKPLFAQKDVPIKSVSLFGKNSNVLKLVLSGVTPDGREVSHEAVMFENAAENYEIIKNEKKISILYQISLNEFKGNVNVNLQIKDYMV